MQVRIFRSSEWIAKSVNPMKIPAVAYAGHAQLRCVFANITLCVNSDGRDVGQIWN